MVVIFSKKIENLRLALKINSKNYEKLKKRNKEISSILIQQKNEKRKENFMNNYRKMKYRLDTVLSDIKRISKIFKKNPKAKLKQLPEIPKDLSVRLETKLIPIFSDYILNVLRNEYKENEKKKEHLKKSKKEIIISLKKEELNDKKKQDKKQAKPKPKPKKQDKKKVKQKIKTP